MRRGLAVRLIRLESRAVTVAECNMTVRFGNVKRLPPGYTGERHVIVARELPSQNGQEWVEFEEVPGPAPEPPERSIVGRGRSVESRLDIMFVEADPPSEGSPL